MVGADSPYVKLTRMGQALDPISRNELWGIKPVWNFVKASKFLNKRHLFGLFINIMLKFNKHLLRPIFLTFFLFSLASQLWASEAGGGDTDIVHRVSILVIQVSLIIFAAWTGGILFIKLRLPSVLGEIIAGVVIGPYCLGHIPVIGFQHGLFPLQATFPVTVELYSLATIASIVLLFIVGLETDLDTFVQFSLAGSVVGIFGTLVSFVLGDIVGILFSNYILGVHHGFFHPVSLFFGIISTATSVGISARILSARRRMNSSDGVTILSAAVIDDILGIIALAVVIAVAKTKHVEFKQVFLILIKTIGIWIIFTALGLRYSRHLSKYLNRIKNKRTIALLCFALALMLAGIFEQSGLALIIGAYTMGLSFSKTDLAFLIQEEMEMLQRFFVPIFFCVMGMLIDPTVLASHDIMLFGVIYIVFAVLGKLLGCSLPALFLNFNLRGALIIGIGMIPRGEVALIMASIGLSQGIIDHDVFSIAAIMTFATTLITPPILDKLLSSDKPILRKQPPDKKELIAIKFDMPNPETAEFIHRKILDTFKSEGFHSHRQRHGLYFIRKSEIFITFKYNRHQHEFDCLKEDAGYVYTLFYEVISELELFAKKLETLKDKVTIGRRIFDPQKPSKAKQSKVFQKLLPKAVEVNLKGNSKDEILKELVDLLIKSEQLHPSKKDTLFNAIKNREESLSTGMQDGIALPHAKSESVDQCIFVVGLKKEGLDFASLDNLPSKIFIMTIAPTENQHEYLQHMSQISRSLTEEQNRNKILSAKTNKELTEILKSLS